MLAAGDLDATFGIGGKVTTDFLAPSFDTAQAIVLQGDKLVVAGGVGLARYHADGALDTTFGDNGLAVHPGVGRSMAVQSDGKIVVAGNTSLTRFNPDGSLDAEFGNAGKVTISFGGGPYDTEIIAVAVQADGKLVVAGTREYVFFAAGRFNADGSPDDGSAADSTPGDQFGADGTVITEMSIYEANANGVTIQADGRIVLAGTAQIGSDDDFALVRYNPDGSLDSGFGNGGTVTTALSTSYDRAYAVTIQADGKIVAGGTTSGKFSLARYNADGSLDSGFGSGGKVVTTFGNEAYAITVQADGKIVLSGGTQLARFNADGSLDTSFDVDGRVTTFPYSYGVVLQADRIVVAGTANGDFALARYNADGSLDDGSAADSTPGDQFGADGKVLTDFPPRPGLDQATGTAVQADGKVVVAGSSYGNGFVLARYNTDGSLDTSFGDDGRVRTSFGPGSAEAYGIAIQADGKIVAAGRFDWDFALARYNADGSLDTSFGSGGKVITDFASNQDGAWGMTLQPDGKIVAVGYAYKSDGTYDIAVARYHASGALDTTFNKTGKVLTDLGARRAARDEWANDVVIQPDGKVVVVGNSYPVAVYSGGFTFPTGDAAFAVVRYNANGSLDTTFNKTGKVLTDVGPGQDEALSVALRPDGKIVAVGQAGNDLALVQYNANGSLDATFGSGGKIIDPAGPDYAYGLAIQSDGKIVVAGFDFNLSRYHANGSLDTSFGNSGRVATSFGGGNVHDIAILPGGKIVAAGSAYSPVTGWDFALARYLPDEAPTPGTPPTVSVSNASVTEGNSGLTALTFTISLSWVSSEPVTVSYATADGTATAGSDYEAASGTLVFQPGETTKTITIWVYADAAIESDETFDLMLFDQEWNEIGRALGTILNDDVSTGGGKGGPKKK